MFIKVIVSSKILHFHSVLSNLCYKVLRLEEVPVIAQAPSLSGSDIKWEQVAPAEE